MDDSKAISSQLDPRWARETLGNSIYTVKGWGCTITSICRVAFNLNGDLHTPGELAKTLAFDSQGRLIWGSLERIGIKAKRCFDAPSNSILKDNAKRMIIELNYSPRHWVALEETTVLGYIKVMDPLKGDFVSKRVSEISGYTLLESVNKAPIEPSDNVPDWNNVAGNKSAKEIWEASKAKGYISKEGKFDDKKNAGEIMIILARMFPEKF